MVASTGSLTTGLRLILGLLESLGILSWKKSELLAGIGGARSPSCCKAEDMSAVMLTLVRHDNEYR